MLNFEFTDVARVLDIPGLHELLRAALLTQISNYLVLPNKLAFSLASSVDAGQLRYVEPKVRTCVPLPYTVPKLCTVYMQIFLLTYDIRHLNEI